MIVLITHSSSAPGKLMEKSIRDLCRSDFSNILEPDICIVDSAYVTEINGYTFKDLRIETVPVTLYMDVSGSITNQVQGSHTKSAIIHYASMIDSESFRRRYNSYEYVDLGLPSGTLWAKCNVGATKESDYGGYYQWGGTVDYTSTAKTCDWSTYPYGTSSTALTKYNLKTGYGTVDNKTELELSDDITNQVMTGAWHMPTRGQLRELIDNTTSEWTAVDGINGRRFTSKLNGNSIFIPAAGMRYNNSLGYANDECYLWTSSLYQNLTNKAYNPHSNSEGITIDNYFRYYGQSVRGVLL